MQNRSRRTWPDDNTLLDPAPLDSLTGPRVYFIKNFRRGYFTKLWSISLKNRLCITVLVVHKISLSYRDSFMMLQLIETALF